MVKKETYDRSKLRALGREYDVDLVENEKLSNTAVYKIQLDRDLQRDINNLFELREKEFITNNEPFIRYETEENGLNQGFIMKAEDFKKINKSDLKKLYKGL